MNSDLYSVYYQAHIEKSKCYVVTSTMRYFSSIAFDRCFDVENSIFEFFVSPGFEQEFCAIMEVLQKKGVILQYQKLPNRLQPHNQ